MAIPGYFELTLPVLRAVGRLGIADLRTIRKAIAVDLRMAVTDLDERFPSATGRSTFDTRIQWARDHLTRAGLLEPTGRRRYQVTARGQAVLAARPPQIDRAYLRRFPEYSEWELASGQVRSSAADVSQEGQPKIRRNPPWTAEELILALDLYLRRGLLDDRHPEVLRLSEALNALRVHDNRPDAARFRNPNGVALKLANFASLDPTYAGRGMTRGGKRDREVWERYSGDADALREAVRGVSAAGSAGLGDISAERREDADHADVRSGSIEEIHAESFVYQAPSREVDARRREQPLVHAFASYLRARGHRVSRHVYGQSSGAQPLACDLFDETDQMLYEAKAESSRSNVRMAIGQLFDYLHLEAPGSRAGIRLGVLLPRRPSPDLEALLHSLTITVVWPSGEGFEQLVLGARLTDR